VDLVTHQLTTCQTNVEEQRDKVVPCSNTPLFYLLRRRVSRPAILKYNEELVRSRQLDFPITCSCIVRTSMGLPCGHEIQGYDCNRRPLPLSAIHNHWRLTFGDPNENEGAAQHISDPVVLGSNERPQQGGSRM
jgi:alpha-glucosidase